jgi:hypothetical protein
MSERTWPVNLAAGLLIVVSIGGIVGLNLGLIYKLDRWDALPFALLSHTALLPAVAAAGLTWRRGHASLRVLSRILAVVLIAVWLHTWVGPIQDLVSWLSIRWYLWMVV